MRKLILLVGVDENFPINEDMGTIDYLEQEFGWLNDSGIYLDQARIVDEDDAEDNELVKLVDKIF